MYIKVIIDYGSIIDEMGENFIEYNFNGKIFKTDTQVGSNPYYFYEFIHELVPVHEKDIEYLERNLLVFKLKGVKIEDSKK